MDTKASELNNPPAFPSGDTMPAATHEWDRGMLLRDYFAAKADVSAYDPAGAYEKAKGRLPTIQELADYIAQIRLIEADAMLLARQKGAPQC